MVIEKGSQGLLAEAAGFWCGLMVTLAWFRRVPLFWDCFYLFFLVDSSKGDPTIQSSKLLEGPSNSW